MCTSTDDEAFYSHASSGSDQEAKSDTDDLDETAVKDLSVDDICARLAQMLTRRTPLDRLTVVAAKEKIAALAMAEVHWHTHLIECKERETMQTNEIEAVKQEIVSDYWMTMITAAQDDTQANFERRIAERTTEFGNVRKELEQV